MKVLVTGGRNYANRKHVFAELDALHAVRPIRTLMHGGSRGADALAGEWADLKGITVDVWPADWKRLGLAAGPRRNQEMVNQAPDLVLAFPGGRGTADCTMRAADAGLEVRSVKPPRSHRNGR